MENLCSLTYLYRVTKRKENMTMDSYGLEKEYFGSYLYRIGKAFYYIT